jgi:hypothetical protein
VVSLATAIPPLARLAFRRAWTDYDRLRRDASRHLADAALAAGVGRYVQESIAMLYAGGGDRWLDEAAPAADAAGAAP